MTHRWSLGTDNNYSTAPGLTDFLHTVHKHTRNAFTIIIYAGGGVERYNLATTLRVRFSFMDVKLDWYDWYGFRLMQRAAHIFIGGRDI